MYEVNGICCARKCTDNIKITNAKVLRGGMVLVTFSTGEKRLFDAAALKGTAFEPLKDEKILKDFSIFHGVLTWVNGEIDIAPRPFMLRASVMTRLFENGKLYV